MALMITIVLATLLWLHAVPSRAADAIREQLHAECAV
jgi:hypothetical protein